MEQKYVDSFFCSTLFLPQDLVLCQGELRVWYFTNHEELGALQQEGKIGPPSSLIPLVTFNYCTNPYSLELTLGFMPSAVFAPL